MPRYRVTVEYDGTGLVGWQRQAHGASVQASLEDAVFAFSGETVRVNGAGRTDAGVHAAGQVAHFDLERDWPAHRIVAAMNAHLRPRAIAVLACERACLDFDARFSATMRHYRYVVLNRAAPPALCAGHVWHVRRPLDLAPMQQAAKAFLGHHDFTTFRAAACQARSPMRTLSRFSVERDGHHIVFACSARSFLHSQVRSMVGSLKLVGEGRWPCEEISAALAAADRTRCGAIAPAAGLTLVQVDYERG